LSKNFGERLINLADNLAKNPNQFQNIPQPVKDAIIAARAEIQGAQQKGQDAWKAFANSEAAQNLVKTPEGKDAMRQFLVGQFLELP